MCFKTAGLAAKPATAATPETRTVRHIVSDDSGAVVTVTKAEDQVRAAIIKFGWSEKDGDFERGVGGGDHSQYVGPADLRYFAAEFLKLADELAA